RVALHANDWTGAGGGFDAEVPGNRDVREDDRLLGEMKFAVLDSGDAGVTIVVGSGARARKDEFAFLNFGQAAGAFDAPGEREAMKWIVHADDGGVLQGDHAIPNVGPPRGEGA